MPRIYAEQKLDVPKGWKLGWKVVTGIIREPTCQTHRQPYLLGATITARHPDGRAFQSVKKLRQHRNRVLKRALFAAGIHIFVDKKDAQIHRQKYFNEWSKAVIPLAYRGAAGQDLDKFGPDALVVHRVKVLG